MRIAKPILTARRRQRLVLWAGVMLAWLAEVLFAGRKITRRQLRQRRDVSLDELTRLVINLLLWRAFEFLRLRRATRTLLRQRRRHLHRPTVRQLIGLQLWRVFTPKTIRARIHVLIDVLNHFDDWARIIAHRIKRSGVTRIWPVKPAPVAAEALLGAPAWTPALADSS